MHLIILRMQEAPSDQNLTTAAIENYNDLSVPFDPAIFTFPQQLYHLLQIAEKTRQEDTISWANDGKSFTVHDPNQFEATLLVKYFQMKKYASFTRQLCAYGFSCVRKGRKPGLYYHPDFVRDNYDACNRITRGSGKSYQKQSVTYTGEIPPPVPMTAALPISSGWNFQKSYFSSTSLTEDASRKRSKISKSAFEAISTGAFGTRVVQELRNNLEKATSSLTKSQWKEPSSLTGSQSSGSLTPPRTDTTVSSGSMSAPQDDSQHDPGSSNIKTRGLPTEIGSSMGRHEAAVTDTSLLEPRSIQAMMDSPDFSWNDFSLNKRKRGREP